MQELSFKYERKTSTDAVFETLYHEITSLKLLPGTKLPETEVARRFDVSRQPVRDAFGRLSNLDLVQVRPQKATEVRGFSLERIERTQFTRLAIEMEVIRQACAVWNDSRAATLQLNLNEQQTAIDNDNPKDFHTLDGQFHVQLCELSGCPAAVEVVSQCRQKIDRLCMLNIGPEKATATLLEDHKKIADALKRNSVDDATDIARIHLHRLDGTIAHVYEHYEQYFE